VVAVSFAVYSFWLSRKPPDPSHLYGHDRIAFFSAGFEGAMIVLAAVYIVYESIRRLIAGPKLESLRAGLCWFSPRVSSMALWAAIWYGLGKGIGL